MQEKYENLSISMTTCRSKPKHIKKSEHVAHKYFKMNKVVKEKCNKRKQ